MANTYTNAKVDLTSTSATTLYTCATSTTTIVKSILVSEDSNNADTITLTLTNGSDVFSLFKDKVIKTFIHGFLHLLSFDHIKLKDYKKMFKEEQKIYQSVIKKIN